MGSPVIVEFANTRYRLIRVLANWSDTDFQRRQWIEHQYDQIPFALPYHETDTLYDDAGAFPEAREALHGTLGNELEVARVQGVADTYDPIESSESIDWGDNSTLLSHPTWPSVVQLSRRALTVLVLNGGTIDLTTLAARDSDEPSVARRQDRSATAHALASIAEATYRRPSEYSDEDAPAYLVSPERAVETLLTTGHLNDPRPQIDVIYRDAYEEIPRLERVRDSVIRYQANEIALADLADPAVDALCSIIRSGAGWDLNPDELAAAHQRAAEA